MTSGIANTNINHNLLAATHFHFAIERLPYVNYFGQQINLPDINLPSVGVKTPFTTVHRAGDNIEFTPLKVQFSVDEDFRNWEEIYNWMVGLGFPRSTTQYQELLRTRTSSIDPKGSIYSNGNIVLLNSDNNPFLRIDFVDLVPTGLTGLQFDTTAQNNAYLTSTASFAYTLYYISRL